MNRTELMKKIARKMMEEMEEMGIPGSEEHVFEVLKRLGDSDLYATALVFKIDVNEAVS